MGGMKRAPTWILKYKTGIEKGGLKLEDILNVENKIREKPIKIRTVTRAINEAGFSITGLAREKIAEIAKRRIARWILKYRRGIEEKKLKMEDILEMENKIRKKPIKIETVRWAIITMGYPVKWLEREKKEKEVVEKREILKEVAYTSSIGEISKETEEKFMETKESFEKDLGKSLANDYFLNILIVLAKLVEHKKTLKPW